MSSFRSNFTDVLAAAGESLPPTSLSGGGQTGLDAPLAGFLRGFAGVRRQRQQSQQAQQQAEVARARGEFQQSQTLLNLARVGEQGAIGRGLLESFFGANIPRPIEQAFKEQQGMNASAAQGNDPIFDAFISPLLDRGMLGKTPEENQQMSQHMRGVIRSLKPASAATFGRLFSQSVVEGKTVFGLQELSPFIEEAISTREDNLARDGSDLRRQISAANRRSAGEVLRPTTKARLPQLANRPAVSVSDEELAALGGAISIQDIDAIRQARDAAIREVQQLRKQERAASRHRMTLRRPDWPPTVQGFDQTYHADNIGEGVAAALLDEVKDAGVIKLDNIEGIIKEMQSLANDRFWDSLSEEHAFRVIEADPALRHLAAPDLSNLEIPGIGVMTQDDLEFFAKEQGLTIQELRQRLIKQGAIPSP